jgi:NAD(P)-dependent dehydrogenase (short-subunit alcohol dehydrogenase family)
MASTRAGAFLLGAAGGLATSMFERAFAPSLRDHVVVVTGGSRGLGLLIAEELAALDCRLVLCARDERELEQAACASPSPAPGCSPAGDVRRREDMDRVVDLAVSRFGGWTCWSTTRDHPGRAAGGDDREDFERAMDTMLYGTLNAVEAVLPFMKRRRRGRIVNVTSIGGRVAVPHLLPYTCAKFAQQGLSEGLFAELRRHGISVTTVAPGLMRTGSAQNALFKGRQDLEKLWFSLGATLPLTAMSARRAARRIVLAARRREAFVVLSWQARLLRLAHDLFPPRRCTRVGGGALLPHAAGPTDSVKGMDLRAPARWSDARPRREADQRVRGKAPGGPGAPRAGHPGRARDVSRAAPHPSRRRRRIDATSSVRPLPPPVPSRTDWMERAPVIDFECAHCPSQPSFPSRTDAREAGVGHLSAHGTGGGRHPYPPEEPQRAHEDRQGHGHEHQRLQAVRGHVHPVAQHQQQPVPGAVSGER